MTVTVGGALRKVRASRGLSIDEAARDTRIRREFLEAIEVEDFDRLLGDVHVRGCLRTYASYLRLSPEKVIAAYVAARPEAAEPESVTAPLQPEPVLGTRRRRDDHRLLVMIATTILVLAAAFGVLSSRQPAPPPAEMASEAPAAAAPTRPITLAVLARLPVEVTITADGGEPQIFQLEPGEGRSFDARTTITVRLSEGGTASITVSGTDKGFPGAPERPWQETYAYDAATPSATP
ncbi:MAG: helix-turn-helix domain-containing protein [Actinomycetota bacterium]